MPNFPKDGYIGGLQKVQTGRTVDNAVVKVPELRVGWYSVAPEAVDTDGVLEVVTLEAGLEIHAPDGQPDIARQLVVTGDVDSEGAVVSILGTDIFGNSISENVTIPGAGDTYAALTGQAFASVTSIQVVHSEVYVLALDTPDGGTYKLGNDDDGWTDPIAHDAAKAAIEAALEEVYGDGNVVVDDGSDFTITFEPGLGAALELDSELTSASEAALTASDMGDVKIGLGRAIGLPAVADAPTALAVYFHGGVVAPGTWAHTVDGTDGAVAENILDPGGTAGAAFNGTKILDVYFGVAGIRE